MNWDDTGYLISKNKYNENSVIADFFTEKHGKCSGIIFGATSKKTKNYLQIGNKFHLNYNYKDEGKIGYFKLEIYKVFTPLYFDSKKKLLCIASAMNLIKVLTADLQENDKIFKLIDKFYYILENENWIKNYIFWELELFKLVGFDLELKKIAKSENIHNKVTYFVESKSEKKNIPNFLIDDKDYELTKLDLVKGLKLVGDYLDKTILKPNNITFPNTRIDFVNILK
tara:strand:+ start:668 stop:1348 length:681 start_codon:yes stop_codon:yes gene_type:complete